MARRNVSLCKGLPGDGFMYVVEIADGELWAKEALGVGTVGIPLA